MEKVKEEAYRESGKPDPKRRIPGRILFRLFLRKIRRKTRKPRMEEPWARIRVRRGIKTLVWGAGDGKTFGTVSLGPEVVFSVGTHGVRLDSPNGSTVIGVPEKTEENRLLARKIEKLFRKPGVPPWILWGAGSVIVVLGALALSGGMEFRQLASLSADIPGNGGGDSLPAMSGLPSSMSSGLTCRTH